MRFWKLLILALIFVGCDDVKVNLPSERFVFYRLKSGNTQIIDDNLYLACDGKRNAINSCYLKSDSSALKNSLVFLRVLNYSIANINYRVNTYYHDDKSVHDDEIVVYALEDEVIAVDVLNGADLVNGSRPLLMMLYILINNDCMSKNYDFMSGY